jgi:2-keto-4-pentenoate hydratase/2-oxohepta-3-ene-1,7-dioic acid hydratase in catechol pathway
MKLCRFQPLHFRAEEVTRGPARREIHPQPLLGAVEGASVRQISGDFFHGWSPTQTIFPLEQVKLLPPVEPSKIVCLGRNYSEHAAELGNAVPKEPLIFLKAPSAIIGPDEPIVLTPLSQRVDHEGELALIIGKRCSQLAADADVRPYIFGYTCLNDVTARDLQKVDVQFTRAKGFDTFCPVGPVIETDLDLKSATIETFVNGQRKQSAPLTDMIFPVDVIIRWVSRMMTLLPGDIISTGTPAGVGPLRAGDVVEVVVSGVATLRNPVVAPEP